MAILDRKEAGRRAHASAVRVVGGVLLCLGLASFGVLAFATRKLMSLDRVLDIGDVVVLGVFATFGIFCAGMGWRVLRSRPAPSQEARPLACIPPEPAPPRRVTLSHACAAAGVLLLILSVLLPAHWYPVAFFFVGLALLAVSHGLTPCVERLEQLRKARASERQL
ncbi:MAG: hypothetical protein ACREUN_16170 [Burkholderiales bacterium]